MSELEILNLARDAGHSISSDFAQVTAPRSES